MANTRAEIFDEVFNILAEDSEDGNGEYSPASVNTKINQCNTDVIKGGIQTAVNSIPIKAPDLSFMRKKYFFTYVAPTKLSADVATSDTEIEFVCTDYQSVGAVSIKEDIVEYTGKNGANTQIEGVTGIDTTHTNGDTVFQVRKMPSTGRKRAALQDLDEPYPSDETFVHNINYKDPRDTQKYRMVLTDNSGNQYLHVVGFGGGERFLAYYYNLPTDITADSSECDLPDNLGLKVIAPIVAGNILIRSGEVSLGQNVLLDGINALRTMYNQYADDLQNHRQKTSSPSIHRNQRTIRRNRNIYY